MENVFRNQLLSKNQSLRGNALANSLPRNGPHVTIWCGMNFYRSVCKVMPEPTHSMYTELLWRRADRGFRRQISATEIYISNSSGHTTTSSLWVNGRIVTHYRVKTNMQLNVIQVLEFLQILWDELNCLNCGLAYHGSAVYLVFCAKLL
jgi:hypothetical protein